jgi:hypothetical protein
VVEWEIGVIVAVLAVECGGSGVVVPFIVPAFVQSGDHHLADGVRIACAGCIQTRRIEVNVPPRIMP